MRFLATALVLLGPLLALFSAPASAQTDVEFTSPTYGFTVQWDPEIWEEVSDQRLVANGPDDLDRAVIRSGDASLYLEGATRYAGDAEACVAAEVDVLGQDPQVTSETPAEEFTSGDATRATGGARFDLELEDGTSVMLVGYVDCQPISDEAVFIASVIAPEEFFQTQLPLANAVIDSIALEGAPEITPEATAPPAATPEADNAEPETTFVEVRDQAIAAPPDAGPLAADLTAELDSIAKLNSDLTVADFFASAIFTNPYAGSENPFDIGFGFRDTGGDDQLRLIVDSAGGWYVMEGAGSLVFSGTIDNFNPGAGETNMLDLVVTGDTGYFAVNNQFVSDFDASSYPAAGGVWAGSGFFATDIQPEAVTNVSDFLVWSLDAGDLGTPVSGTPVPGAESSGAATSAVEVNEATFPDWVALAKTRPALVGPRNGSVEPNAVGAGLVAAEVDVADALVQVRWANPAAGAESTGIMLRAQPDDGPFIRLSLNADGTWNAVGGDESELATGPAPSLKTEPGAINTLSLVFVDGSAGFTVNGEFVGAFDTGDLAESGDVWFGAGFGDEPAADEQVNYRDFSVWSLNGLSLAPSSSEATPAPSPEATPEPTTAPEPTSPVDAAPTAEPTTVPEELPTEVPPVTPASSGSGAVRAIAVDAVGDSGISGLATITTVNDSAALNLVLQGLNGGELVVVQEGTCEALSPDPAFLLNPLDAGGRSKTTLAVPPEELAAQEYAVVVHPSIEGFGETLACGNIN